MTRKILGIIIIIIGLTTGGLEVHNIFYGGFQFLNALFSLVLILSGYAIVVGNNIMETLNDIISSFIWTR